MEVRLLRVLSVNAVAQGACGSEAGHGVLSGSEVALPEVGHLLK